MRLGARRPPGAWRAFKSGLFGAAPGRTPPAGRRWPCFTGQGGQAQAERIKVGENRGPDACKEQAPRHVALAVSNS